MAFIEWKDALSVKIKTIDDQHKHLVDLINKLHDAMSQGKSKDIMDDLLTKLAQYTVEHFKAEEVIMDRTGYPEAPQHKLEHYQFVQKVNEFKSGFESGQVLVSLKIMTFLRDWLLNHIAGTDQKYTEYFQSHGVQ